MTLCVIQLLQVDLSSHGVSVNRASGQLREMLLLFSLASVQATVDFDRISIQLRNGWSFCGRVDRICVSFLCRCFVGGPRVHNIPHFQVPIVPVGRRELLRPCRVSGPAGPLLSTPDPAHSL